MTGSRAFPTVGDYLTFALSQGCHVDQWPSAHGAPRYQVVRISSAQGGVAVEVFVADADPLTSTEIARLDRRLGLKSYLFI